MYGTWGWEVPVHQGKLNWSPYICSGTALSAGRLTRHDATSTVVRRTPGAKRPFFDSLNPYEAPLCQETDSL
jgi:hypothetical protein